MNLEELIQALRELLASAEAESRDLTEEEAARAEDLTGQIQAAQYRSEVHASAAALLVPGRPALPGAPADVNPDDIERRFDVFLRSGGLDGAAEFRAQSEGTGSAGGYLVPSGFRDQIVERREAFGGFASAAETINTTTGEPLEWATLDDTANTGVIVPEGTALPSGGADLVFGTKVLGAYKYGTGGASNDPLKVSLELLQDNAFDLRGRIAGWMATRIGRAQAPHWLTGTGVGQPEGLLTNKAAYDEITSNVNGPDYGELVSTVHTVDPDYRDGATWVMHDTTLATIRKLVDGNGRPLISEANASVGNAMGGTTLLGYRVIVDNAMPQIGDQTKFLAFGRMNDAYIIRRVLGFTLVVLNELYATTGHVGFLGWERADGAVNDTNAFVVLAGQNV